MGLAGGYLLGNFLPLSNVFPEYRLVFERVDNEKAKDEQTLEQAEPVVVEEQAQPASEVPSLSTAEETKAEKSVAPVAPVTKPEPKPAAPVAEKKTVVPSASQTVAAKAPEKKADTPAADKTHDQYAAMDARVRLGAYRIVGTDHIEKVREGDNLAKIARRTLGPDMECYIEVYNGLKASSQLKTGQAIKIPKLEWKKKKKAQTVN